MTRVSVRDKQSYTQLRNKAEGGYAPVGDQLDAIMEGFEAIIKDGKIPMPQSVKDAVAHWRGVKTRVPKTPPGKK